MATLHPAVDRPIREPADPTNRRSAEVAAEALCDATYHWEMEDWGNEPDGEVVNDFASRAAHPRLRPFVDEYQGYRMAGLAPGTHAGLPSQFLTFIVAFDDMLDVSTTPDDADRTNYWGMLAGLHATPATVYHPGRQHGIQLSVTPRGATALFGVPASALAGEVTHLDAVVPRWADELIHRLSAAGSWRTRWAIVDDVLLRELGDESRLAPELEQAWETMRAFHGAVPVSELAREVGWSRRHFSDRFRSAFGLTPKTMARVLRFERAQKLLRLPTAPSLASVAAACGYADQAHMTREWAEFAGSPPTTWLQDESLQRESEEP